MEDHVIRWAAFDKFAMFHDIERVRDVVGQANIVGDEDQGYVSFVAQLNQVVLSPKFLSAPPVTLTRRAASPYNNSYDKL